MAANLESVLSRVVEWSKKSVERNDYVQWPTNMLPYLEREFHLLPKDMAALQCVGRRGALGGLPVNFVRVCNRAMAREQGIIIKGYHDLDKHPELVLFEGHMFKGGTVHLRKKEPMVAK